MAFEVRKGNRLLSFLFCLIANAVCFGICYYFGFSIRLEHVGSFYAAAAFGLGPAISVAVISQFLYALFYFGFSNILMLIPVILIIFLIHSAVNFGWIDTVISSLGTMVLASSINMVLVLIISLLIGRDSFLNGTCWLEIYDVMARHAEYSVWNASLVSVVPFALFNTCATWVLSMLAYRFTPKQTTLGFSENRIYYKKGLQNRK
ncbi:MAG: hypothetical protein IJN42_02980 [Clostridia bacterium]|nr:hypothetical protein [Clostridia bacterium]